MFKVQAYLKLLVGCDGSGQSDASNHGSGQYIGDGFGQCNAGVDSARRSCIAGGDDSN